MMEKSVQDKEQKLETMVDQKPVQAKRAKLAQLEKLDKSLGKFKDAKGEKKTEVLISDLGKDVKLKTLADLGLVSDSSLSSQSDSSDFLKFVWPLKTHKQHKNKKAFKFIIFLF